jgi:flagellar hook protein FlgE
MTAISIAASGMTSAIQRLDDAANTIANAGKLGSDADFNQAAIQQIQAEQSFEACVSVVRTADEMSGQLLNLKV